MPALVLMRRLVRSSDQDRARKAFLLAVVALLSYGRAASGQSSPSPASAPLARYVPRQDLAAYWEFEGLNAHADAWSKTAASRLLNQTPLGSLLEDLAGQAITLIQQSTPAERRLPPADYLALLKQAVRDGAAFAVLGKDPSDTQFVLAIRKGNQPGNIRMLEVMAASDSTLVGVRPENELRGGRKARFFDRNGVWWTEGEDLILTSKSSFETILEVIEGKQASIVGTPARDAVRRSENGVEIVAHGVVDLAVFPVLPPGVLKLGLDGLKRVEVQWGFQDDALVTSIRLVAPSPRRGLLGLFDQLKFNLRSLPPIPAGQTAFGAFSVNPGKVYEQLSALAKDMNQPPGTGLDAFVNGVRSQFGLDPRADLLEHLGPQVAVYAPTTTPPEGNPLAAMVFPYTGLTISIQSRDEAALGKTLERLAKGLNEMIALRPPAPGGDPPQFRKKDGPSLSYVLEFPPGSVPDGPLGLLSPTIALDKGQLVISGTAEAAEKALALASGPADRRWSPAGEFVPIARSLPSEFSALIITDPRLTVPVVIENLPTIVQAFNAQMAQARAGQGGRIPEFNLSVDVETLPRVEQLKALLFPASTAVRVDAEGIEILQREAVPSVTSPSNVALLTALLLPAVQSAREAARRMQCVNNLKQILLAAHNYVSADDHYPGDITDKEGKPLLSWRVSILPYIEQAELYNKFKLDEPWDSPHNKELLKEMPAVFRCPDLIGSPPFTTAYRGFVGNGAMFEPGQNIGLASITDGTSNTLYVVEAKDAVSWTKPDELPFDFQAKPSLFGAGSPHPGGFNCGFADGTVRFIKDTMAPVVFKALITRAGGEVVSADSF